MITTLTSYYRGIDIPELPGNNIFHSKELFLFYEATPDYTPFLIVAYHDDKPVAKLLSVIRKNTSYLPFPLLKRCEIYGTGEYFDESINNEELFDYMLEHLTNEALRHAFVVEFRNLGHALDGYRYFRKNNYFAINWLRVRNSLHRVTHVMEQFSDSRIRQIRKGLKSGATVYRASDLNEVMEFSRMLYKIYSYRIRKYFPSSHFFSEMKTHLIDKKLADLFIVKYKEKIIGGAAMLYSENNAYIWFSGGMTKRYLNQYPGVLAVWAALDYAKSKGCRHLEFMDVGLPFQKHGYRNFVLRFGGKQSSTRRWFRIRWRPLNLLFIRLYA